jgi:hypothetical protein
MNYFSHKKLPKAFGLEETLRIPWRGTVCSVVETLVAKLTSLLLWLAVPSGHAV